MGRDLRVEEDHQTGFGDSMIVPMITFPSELVLRTKSCYFLNFWHFAFHLREVPWRNSAL
jgi:hypothetical protein